jgi:hypothetical protein
METSKTSTGETLFNLMSYVADTPVSPLVSLEIGAEKRTQDIYGRGYETPLANYDQSTQSWKMYGDTYLWGDCPSLENLPQSGMTRNGVLFQQPAWELTTDETESSLWPTPKANLRKSRRWYLRKDEYRSNAGEVPPGMEHLSGQLINLHWLEWLMGFPIGWTELKDLETQ